MLYMMFTSPAKGGTVVGVCKVHDDGTRSVVVSEFVPHYTFWHKVLKVFSPKTAGRLADLSYARRLDYEIKFNIAYARYLTWATSEGTDDLADYARVVTVRAGQDGMIVTYAERDPKYGLIPFFREAATVFNVVDTVRRMDHLFAPDEILVDSNVPAALLVRMKKALLVPGRIKRASVEGGSV